MKNQQLGKKCPMGSPVVHQNNKGRKKCSKVLCFKNPNKLHLNSIVGSAALNMER